MLGLDDAAWTSIGGMVATAGTLIAVLVGNRRSSVVEQKVDTGVKTAQAIQHSVTTPADDDRTVAEIISENHPKE